MLVRPATRLDLPAIVAANLAMAEETEGLRLDQSTVEAGVLALLEGRAPGAYWVAELEGQVIGQLAITYEWSDWRNRVVWWVQSVYVQPSTRRLGVFAALYTNTRAAAVEAGAAGLRLYVDTRNTRAQQVYQSFGMNGDHYRVFEEMFDSPSRAGSQ
jgi:GNAT superfamily N-acetyltransferase